MKVWLEKYFGFTQKEIRGLCVLILLLCLLIIFPTIHSLVQSDEKEKISLVDEKEIRDFLAAIQYSPKNNLSPSNSPQVEIAAEYFDFNPNDLSLEDGIRLGLSDRQVRMIHNYVAKGGSFSKKEDFKKIYAINDHDYERLYPYLSIPEKRDSKLKNSKLPFDSFAKKPIENKGEIEKLSIELNSTDSIKLQQLKGIGPVFASRIIRFRDNLGGFHDVSQLLSVYGMDQERFDGIKQFITVDTLLVRKIDVNQADYETLRSHSFISYKQASAIVNYRKQHGEFKTIHDLLKIAFLDEEFLLKIAPYLTF